MHVRISHQVLDRGRSAGISAVELSPGNTARSGATLELRRSGHRHISQRDGDRIIGGSSDLLRPAAP